MNELPDGLLRGALRDSASAAAPEVCADAEAFAAWADGTMSGSERAAFETHAADCARCQALMAAMARTEPPPIEIAAAWWRRSPFSWLMPLAVATAALVVVVHLTRSERPVSAPAPAIAPQASAAAAAVPPSTAGREAASSAGSAPASPVAPPRRALSRSTDALRDGAANRNEAARRDEAARREEAARHNEAARVATNEPPPALKTESRAKAAAAADAQIPITSAAPPPAPRAAPEMMAARDRAAVPLAGANAAIAAPTLIGSPDPESQWRIVHGAIEHSGDGGRTWQAQPLGTTDAIRAGSAPDARVCWAVGVGGTVMLTSDGLTWRRIEFPETVDLAGVRASDASHATVTTALGRSYVTADGGKTWTRK